MRRTVHNLDALVARWFRLVTLYGNVNADRSWAPIARIPLCLIQPTAIICADPGHLMTDRSRSPFLDILETAHGRRVAVRKEEAPCRSAPSHVTLRAILHADDAQFAVVKVRQGAVRSHFPATHLSRRFCCLRSTRSHPISCRICSGSCKGERAFCRRSACRRSRYSLTFSLACLGGFTTGIPIV